MKIEREVSYVVKGKGATGVRMTPVRRMGEVVELKGEGSRLMLLLPREMEFEELFGGRSSVTALDQVRVIKAEGDVAEVLGEQGG